MRVREPRWGRSVVAMGCGWVVIFGGSLPMIIFEMVVVNCYKLTNKHLKSEIVIFS